MAESARDHGTVLEVLCAFVRARAPRDLKAPVRTDGEPPADIAAVLTVLARRPRRPEPNRPDLRGADLSRADLSRADLRGAEQLAEALMDDKTVLPDALADDPWVAARLADCLAWFRLPFEDRDDSGPPRTPKPLTTPGPAAVQAP